MRAPAATSTRIGASAARQSCADVGGAAGELGKPTGPSTSNQDIASSATSMAATAMSLEAVLGIPASKPRLAPA